MIVTKPRYVRVNTLYHTPDEIIKIFRNEGWFFVPPPGDYSQFLDVISNLGNDSFTRDFHIKELLVFPSNVQFYNNELYQNGSILLQDKASCLPAFLLEPAPNSVALDMCAAPGMKTTHLSALMRNKGQIYATEVDSARFKVLCDVVESAGCTNVTPINIDALKLNQNSGETERDMSWCENVEYILVDPSCSGSGIVKRLNIFSEDKNDTRRLKKLSCFQFKLLMHALSNFPRAKRVVYSTCSVLPEENEKVVEDVLKRINSLEEENCEPKSQPKFRLIKPLEETWYRRGSSDYEHGEYCIFADPKKDLTNGFFIAVFERIEYENIKSGSKSGKDKKEKTSEADPKSDNTSNDPLPEASEFVKRKRKSKKVESQSISVENENSVIEDESSCKKKKHKDKRKHEEKNLQETHVKPKKKRK